MPRDLLGYLAVVVSVQFLGAGVSLIVATVLLAVTTTLLGWWPPALHERRHSHHRWPIVVSALAAVAALMNLGGTDWDAYSGTLFAASLALLLVGFTEELVARGLLLTALRGRMREVGAWFLTSLLFGHMHFVNVLLGAPVDGTVGQVLAAFTAGTTFYILRRTTGSLVWAMLLHGLWDFSVFASGAGEAGALAPLATVLDVGSGLLALVCVAFVIRGADERTAPTSTPRTTEDHPA